MKRIQIGRNGGFVDNNHPSRANNAREECADD